VDGCKAKEFIKVLYKQEGYIMAKQKMKTSKTAAKRFKVTKNGKIMRRHANAWHKCGDKRRSTMRALRLEDVVADSDKPRILRLLGQK